MSSDKKKVIRKSVLLDETTVKILEEYAESKTGTKNISSAIRQIARELNKNGVSK